MKTLLLAGTLLFLWADTALSAAAAEKFAKGGKGHAVTCAATLSKRTFTLSADLDCSNATAPITITDRAQLNLNGHKLSSHVVLDGRHAQLQNGNVDCPEESAGSNPCVLLRGTGQHLLRNVSVHSLVAGNEATLVHITSNNNLLTGNTVSLGSAGVGFGIAGNNNILRGNIVRPAGDVAYSISGNKNLLINNSSVALIPFGRFSRNFSISGDGNTLSHNVVSSGEQSDGAFYLLISASNNLISRNVIFNNPISIQGQNNVIEHNLAPFAFFEDHNTNCDNNIWRDNVFESANQACIQ